MSYKWKKLSSKEVYRNRWLWVTEDKVKTHNGQQLTYGVIHKKLFALIIPWDGKRLTLVGQYRYIVDEFTWEFPQGHYEHKSIKETARQELHEETGIIAKSIKKIGSFWIGPGVITQQCIVFLATDLTQTKPSREISEEGMKMKKISITELKRLIKSGKIKDGPTITALSILDASGLVDL